MVGSQKIELNEGRIEQVSSMASSPRGECLFVAICQKSLKTFSSRILIFKVQGKGLLENTFIVDQLAQKIPKLFVVKCLRYFEGKVILVALPREKKSEALLYEYNPKKEELVELSNQRVQHHEKQPLGLHQVDDWFYYTGGCGRVMRLRVLAE